jgi:hypothetical protein
MNGFGFFVLIGLPLLIGTGGILATILFRRHMRAGRQAEMNPGE